MRKNGSPDVVIIGSGAGGGMAAKVLAEGGANVLLLEKGPSHFPDILNYSTQPSAGSLNNNLGNDELKFAHRSFIEQDIRIEPRTFRKNDSQSARIAKVNTLAVTVGGGTIHYDGNSPRCAQKDFQVKTNIGSLEGTNIEDWPLTYDDLEPYYDAVEKTVGVQGQHGINPFEEYRTNPYPMAPGYQKYHSLFLADSAKQLGYHPCPTPIAINSVPYKGRPACANCGFCGTHGCAINAKGSTAVTAIPDALATGRCDLITDRFVYRLETNSAGDRIEGVTYIDELGNHEAVCADVFILAGNAIESSRLCLLSASGAFPTGLGNSSDMVGRNLMFHSVYSIFGLFPERLHNYRGRVGTLGMDDFNQAPILGDPERPFGGGIVEFGAQLHPIDEAKYLPLIGDLHKKYMRISPFREHMGVVTFIAEDPPVSENRVDLDESIKDVYNMPVSRITYQAHENDRAVAAHYMPKLKEILWNAGAVFVLGVSLAAENGGIPDTKHILGTLRMGADPATSVTNQYGRFHDIENLYCADGGVFTTSTGYNPTLTIQALAYRQADHILGGR